MNELFSILRQLDDVFALLRARVSPITVIAAVLAAGGVVVMWVGLMSVRRVSLDEEATRISGIRAPSPLEQFQMRLYQSGLRIKIGEFLLVGILLGLLVGGLMAVLGFVAAGILIAPFGPLLYYRYLMHRRDIARRAFRQQLPDTIHDFLQYYALRKNVALTVAEMANKGPMALRPEFAQADSLIRRMYPIEAVLTSIGQARPEAFFRQFMDALAQHDQQGGNLRAVLLRIARGQRSQLRLHSRILAQQSGARMVGTIYAVAPVAFLLFVRVMGGDGYSEFFASPLGQLLQVFVLASGALSWWITHKVATRGIYLNEDPSAPMLTSEVKQTGFTKPILPNGSS